MLRGREHGKYSEDKADGAIWYGATYPRSLDDHFRPKLVLQVLSRKPSVTLDLEGNFVFTAWWDGRRLRDCAEGLYYGRSEVRGGGA